MDIGSILVNSCWCGLFASCLSVLFTAPSRFIGAAFFCGFVGRFARDVLVIFGMGPHWSTAVAATLIVVVATIITRRSYVSPVVMISSVLPLGAAVAMFKTITELMKVSVLDGEALSKASVALTANAGKTFITSLTIALGLAVGIAIVRLFSRKSNLDTA